ncbi:hypothetical protein D1872_252070 [compost metagenome]
MARAVVKAKAEKGVTARAARIRLAKRVKAVVMLPGSQKRLAQVTEALAPQAVQGAAVGTGQELVQLAASALAVARAGITRQHPGQASDGRRRLPAVFSSAEQLHQEVMPDQTVKAQHDANGRIRAEVAAIAPLALCGKRRSRWLYLLARRQESSFVAGYETNHAT